MTILPTGNVGIGTTSPATILNVVTGSNADGIQIRRNSGTTNDFTTLSFAVSTSISPASGAEIRAIRTNRAVSSDTDLRFITRSNDTNAERMTIRDDGNVGIGTTSPSEALQISSGNLRLTNGTGFTTANSLVREINVASGSANQFITSSIGFRIGAFSDEGIITFGTAPNASSPTEKMRILGNGNVGIGTTAPASLLHLYKTSVAADPIGSSNNASLRIQTDGSELNEKAEIQFKIGSDLSSEFIGNTMAVITATYSNFNSTSDIGGHLLFSTRQSTSAGGILERLRILNSGLVGINETAPTAQLQVKSGGQFRPGLVVDTSSGFSGNIAEFKNNGTNFFIIDTFGNIGGESFYRRGNPNQGGISLATTGAQISRNIADTNPALIVNLANASATGNIQVWQTAGVVQSFMTRFGHFGTFAGMLNATTGQNAFVSVPSTGTVISRDIADANSALKVNIINASSTANIAEFQFTGTTQASVARDGIANFTGTPSNAQTGDYTLVLADKGKVLRVNSATNRTVTIPLNSSVAFPIDTEIAILRYGTGTVSISPTSGVTLNSVSSNRKVKDQYGSVALKKIGENEWVLVGSLEA
jgi:hypothetical protein